MNTKKIEVLKKAIQMLEKATTDSTDLKYTGEHYAWGNPCTCNCGFILLAIGGVSHQQIYHSIQSTYSSAVNEGSCSVTGLPFGAVRDAMLENGFTKKDITELERLSNVEVRKKYGGWLKQDHKQDVIAYMKAWVSILEEQQPKEVEYKAPAYRVIEIHSEILQEAREIIGTKETIANQ